MTTLTEKFEALETQLAAQAAVIQGYTDEVEGKLTDIFNTLDVMNVNNAANTRYLLTALAQIDPCATCPPASLIVPPTGSTFAPVDSVTCQRSQAFIAFMDAVFSILDVVSGLGTGTFPSLVISAYNEVIASSAMFTGVPVIDFPAAVNVIGDTVNYALSNIGRGDTLTGVWSGIKAGLLPELAGSTSSSDAQSRYQAYIAASGIDSDEKLLMTAAAYNGLFDWFFDPGSSPDLTGFDGSICGGALIDATSCVDLVAVLYGDTDGFDRYHIFAPVALSGSPTTIAGDFFGWTYQVIDGFAGKPTLFDVVTSPTTAVNDGTSTIGNPATTVTHHGIAIVAYTDHDGPGTKPFTLRMCPPA